MPYLQDKNAGNLGDYLKHFYLLELIERIIKENPAASIAYIDSHAGAGKYDLKNEHWKNRYKYQKIVSEEDKKWEKFYRLNNLIDNKQYFGSFILAEKFLIEHKDMKSKVFLYEKKKRIRERIVKSMKLFPNIAYELKEKSSPGIIQKKISNLSKKYDIIICLIDPYFKEGKKDEIWCKALSWDNPNCYLLMFDFARGRGKDPGSKLLKFIWHCSDDNIIGYKPWAINGYAIFGNKPSLELLKRTS